MVLFWPAYSWRSSVGLKNALALCYRPLSLLVLCIACTTLILRQIKGKSIIVGAQIEVIRRKTFATLAPIDEMDGGLHLLSNKFWGTRA
jgi:hypothetical protein